MASKRNKDGLPAAAGVFSHAVKLLSLGATLDNFSLSRQEKVPIERFKFGQAFFAKCRYLPGSVYTLHDILKDHTRGKEQVAQKLPERHKGVHTFVSSLSLQPAGPQEKSRK